MVSYVSMVRTRMVLVASLASITACGTLLTSSSEPEAADASPVATSPAPTDGSPAVQLDASPAKSLDCGPDSLFDDDFEGQSTSKWNVTGTCESTAIAFVAGAEGGYAVAMSCASQATESYHVLTAKEVIPADHDVNVRLSVNTDTLTVSCVFAQIVSFFGSNENLTFTLEGKTIVATDIARAQVLGSWRKQSGWQTITIDLEVGTGVLSLGYAGAPPTPQTVTLSSSPKSI